jgi:hypothetical protein
LNSQAQTASSLAAKGSDFVVARFHETRFFGSKSPELCAAMAADFPRNQGRGRENASHNCMNYGHRSADSAPRSTENEQRIANSFVKFSMSGRRTSMNTAQDAMQRGETIAFSRRRFHNYYWPPLARSELADADA